ncbi:uncharacterized protein LOC134216195 [Armigeres subalbatus]|uniref:uncharacterized protein LOC134216195 n=1 Tax=Armigeres subalbatus TaxID=124917 RepID=UPI002ED0CB00
MTTINTNTELSIIDIQAVQNQMRNLSIGFNLKWLDVNVLPRKTVFEIQHDVQQKILKPFQEVVETMQIAGLLSVEGKKIFEKMFEMFDGADTEYKFMQSLKSTGLYADPREYVISNELRPGVINNEQGMDNDPITGILMPIKFQLKKYLESPMVFETILGNLNPSPDGYIRSLIDGIVWQQKVAGHSSNIVIPLNLFFDDFTTKDTASPHASRTSVLGVYYYIPCLPGYILAKLANILVAGYILSEDRKEYENEELFSNLVEVLIDLELNGVNITHNGANVTVHFMVGFITGDNLGISGILDLVESARANFYCRLCKRNREQREKDTVEYEESFRTIDGYDQDLRQNDVSSTGIHKNSIFNSIPSYHVVSNVYFDLMHDLWEGVCMYGLAHCLNYFIKVKRCLALLK